MFVSIHLISTLLEKSSKDKLSSSESNSSSSKCQPPGVKREGTNKQEANESVSEGFVSPVVVENSCPIDQGVSVAGPSKPKSARIEGSFLESLRTSLKEEITSEIKNLLVESQREMLKLIKPERRENVRENADEETGNVTRSFYTPTKSVRINSTQNDDPCSIRNNTMFDFVPISLVKPTA